LLEDAEIVSTGLVATVAAGVLALLPTVATAQALSADTLPADIVAGYRQSTAETDYVRREAMIPMRDGVKLYTLILMKTGTGGAPILMERTPYGADGKLLRLPSQKLDQLVPAADAAYVQDGYIRVWQDVRGKGRSEGVYVANRPISGPLNPTGIDHATDAYDTIEWLIRNLPETNGRVGAIGGSYGGFTTLMATLSDHPALKAAVAINPMVDVWMGDDWFHHGAFRPITLAVVPLMMSGKGSGLTTPTGVVDLYARMLESGSTGDFIRRYGLDAFPATRRFMEHPAYDTWWQGQALDKVLASRPIKTPLLLVGGRYDEQDQYGAPAVFRALQPLDRDGKVSLLLGPWAHMGVLDDGSGLGAIRFDEDTAARARREVIAPFLDAQLKTGAKPAELAPVISYATGGGWHRANTLPEAVTPLYLRAGGKLVFKPPEPGEKAQETYVSDPMKPVAVVAKPFYFGSRTDAWKTSLIADQRVAGQRPDVLTFVTEPLEAAVHVFGRPEVELFAATTGSDSDFVVKLIDVYPDEMADLNVAGYQLPVSMDIFRGRYLKGFDQPAPLTPGRAQAFRFPLPVADHVFAKGHRIMVQVQSTWFPVYDRNPQTYVPNIFHAKPGDYRAATQTVFHSPARPSAVRLPIVTD
jgi:putative CocE/NonD family hydrolase